jgi:hypothetical protein
MDNYFEIDRLSNSGLTKFWREVQGLPAFFAKESTLEFGQLFHSLLYEPQVNVMERVLKLSPSDAGRMARMLASATQSPIVRHFIMHPEAVFEKVVLFDLYGVPFKMRADVMIPPRKSGHDAKTTACSSLDAFLATFDDYGYWRQAEIYKQGAGLKNFFFTGISKGGQHQTFTVDVSKHADKMRNAKKEVRDLVHLYKTHKKDEILRRKED